MIRLSSFAITLVLIVSNLPTCAAYAAGALPRAWVSALGSDNNACGAVDAPCRTLQYVLDGVVKAGGSIYIHDSAGFDSIVVRNAISIINEGAGTAVILAASGDAVAIQAGPNDTVLIKGLVIDGVGSGRNGINLTTAGKLIVSDCTITGFQNYSSNQGNGILINPNQGTTTFAISDTKISGNAGAGVYVIPSAPNFQTGTASSTGTISRVQTVQNGYGVNAFGAYTSGKVTVFIDEVNASHNSQIGLEAYSATVYLRRSMATGNLNGVVHNGAPPPYSYGDNAINKNGTDLSSPMTPVALK